jgi:hypothetical protein
VHGSPSVLCADPLEPSDILFDDLLENVPRQDLFLTDVLAPDRIAYLREEQHAVRSLSSILDPPSSIFFSPSAKQWFMME